MKRSMIAVLTLAMGMSNLTFAQGHDNHGKPAATGLERAEQVANPNGISKGIDNAETKEGQGKTQKTSKSRNSKKKPERKRQSWFQVARKASPSPPLLFEKAGKLCNMHDGQRRSEPKRRASVQNERAARVNPFSVCSRRPRSITREYEQHQKQAPPMLKSAGYRSGNRFPKTACPIDTKGAQEDNRHSGIRQDCLILPHSAFCSVGISSLKSEFRG